MKYGKKNIRFVTKYKLNSPFEFHFKSDIPFLDLYSIIAITLSLFPQTKTKFL